MRALAMALGAVLLAGVVAATYGAEINLTIVNVVSP